MDLFSQPADFMDAVKHLLAKGLMPTGMDSAAIKGLSTSIRRQSVFSAQTVLTDYLQEIKDSVLSVLDPRQVPRADRESEANPEGLTTIGMNPAQARAKLKETLDNLSYSPKPGEEGTVKDLSSDKRIDLVVKTNVDLAHGAAAFVQANANEDRVDLFPAQELYRLGARKDPRDWPHRWMLAAQVAGDADAAGALGRSGRMIALKSSGIWDALGEGAGGYEDTLDNPYPPFAFNSGMWTREISRAVAEELGLLDKGEKAEPAEFDWTTLFKIAA